MAGLTDTQIMFFRELSKVKTLPSSVLSLARTVVSADKTNKNAFTVKKLMESFAREPSVFMPLPVKNNNIFVEDVSGFKETRYFFSEREKTVFERIHKIYRAASKLSEMDLRYLNATLLYGESGTGKTLFGRYLAYKLNLPFVYVNFSQLVDSLLGASSKNIASVFRDVQQYPCVLMFDEIDSISEKRASGTSAAHKEENRIVISLMQELDRVSSDILILAATNRLEAIDPALLRRFSIKHEVLKLTKDETVFLAKQFLSDIDTHLPDEEIKALVERFDGQPQAHFVNALVEKIVDIVVDAVVDVGGR